MVFEPSSENEQWVIGYHTQEDRGNLLYSPIYCCKNAWLGSGYYFWAHYDYAQFWGEDKKSKTGSYQVYKSEIRISNFLDTAFNEKDYLLWLKSLKQAIEYVKKNGTYKGGGKIPLKDIHTYLMDKVWSNMNVQGIIYDDTPQDSNKRIHSEIEDLYYKKRLQLVSFSLDNIRKFKLVE